jgi:hypothetical protein
MEPPQILTTFVEQQVECEKIDCYIGCGRTILPQWTISVRKLNKTYRMPILSSWECRRDKDLVLCGKSIMSVSSGAG